MKAAGPTDRQRKPERVRESRVCATSAEDANTEAANRADSWTSAMDGYYNAIKLMGAGNKMLTWYLGETEKHCDTCLDLNLQRHRAAWYSARGYTPRKPGSATDCGGWNCDCQLLDDEGNEFTI